MQFRPLAGVFLVSFLCPRAAIPPPSGTTVRQTSAPVARSVRSRRPAAGATGGGEFAHAISYGHRDGPIGIVQA